MRNLAIAVLLAISAAASAQQRPMSEMQGGCDDYSWNMVREFQLIGTSPITVAALAAPVDEPGWTALDRRLELRLQPAAEVELLAEPGRRHDGAEGSRFAGFVPLTVPRISSYRISSNQRLWIEVIGPSGAVKSNKFEMQAGCEKLVKSVAFALQPDTQYWIQLSGSPVPDPVLLITLDR